MPCRARGSPHSRRLNSTIRQQKHSGTLCTPEFQAFRSVEKHKIAQIVSDMRDGGEGGWDREEIVRREASEFVGL